MERAGAGWRALARRRAGLGLVVAGTMVAVAACGGGSSGGGGGGNNNAGGGKSGGTLVFGTSADPVSMDGAYVSDGESIRVVRQIFDQLVTTKPGSTDIEPSLAEKYEASADGKAWTFTLRKGVKFTDGTTFDAKAVCYNFDRWYGFKGIQQSPSVSYYWQTVFGGFKTQEDKTAPTESLYASCEAKDDTTAVINLTKPSSTFISGLSLPAFSIASPTALQKYNADNVGGTADKPNFSSEFGTSHPVGTGPFKLESFEPNNRLVLVRNNDYWGDKAKLEKLIFKPIADGPARRQSLQSGEIQGYDLVAPEDAAALESAGFQILRRPAFNVGYVGFNQSIKPLDNPKIRQAIAYAINKEALVKAKYPEGAQVAVEFQPPSLFGYAKDVPTYSYDVAKAKALIQESGVANPTIEFWYPTNVSRPYMPAPDQNFQAISADLTAAGFKVVPKSAPWNPDYLSAVNNGKAAVYLLGWTGDFGDPDNFIGTFFRTKQPAWGFANPQIMNDLEAARVESDQSKRAQMYQAINKEIMDFLPGVPYVHTQPALAFAKNVKGFVPSPVQEESFAVVTLG